MWHTLKISVPTVAKNKNKNLYFPTSMGNLSTSCLPERKSFIDKFIIVALAVLLLVILPHLLSFCMSSHLSS